MAMLACTRSLATVPVLVSGVTCDLHPKAQPKGLDITGHKCTSHCCLIVGLDSPENYTVEQGGAQVLYCLSHVANLGQPLLLLAIPKAGQGYHSQEISSS